MMDRQNNPKVRVSAVSYLNAVPLVWGLLHETEYASRYDLTFRVPAGTADMLKMRQADVGIISSIELPRQNLDFVDDLGVASFNAVRSIFLISEKPIPEVRSLATDSGSRTSVALCRIVLRQRFGVAPEMIEMAPDLQSMLKIADAALIIGDAALRLQPAKLPYAVYDLGEEWTKLTGLPMVYAVWAGRSGALTPSLRRDLHASYDYGRDRMGDIVRSESAKREFPEDVAREYLTRYIKHELGSDHLKGLELYLRYARDLDLV